MTVYFQWGPVNETKATKLYYQMIGTKPMFETLEAATAKMGANALRIMSRYDEEVESDSEGTLYRDEHNKIVLVATEKITYAQYYQMVNEAIRFLEWQQRESSTLGIKLKDAVIAITPV